MEALKEVFRNILTVASRIRTVCICRGSHIVGSALNSSCLDATISGVSATIIRAELSGRDQRTNPQELYEMRAEHVHSEPEEGLMVFFGARLQDQGVLSVESLQDYFFRGR